VSASESDELSEGGERGRGAGVGPLARRERDLRSLHDEPWDLVVVGGGIVGAGVLLDAASRGLRAALLERDDIAVGTSSRSSRLIHGGLRYLEHLEFRLVREALDERSRLLRLAAHLVRLEPFLFPVYGLPLVHRVFYGSGLVLYDLFGAARDGGRSHHLDRDATLELVPALHGERLQGAIVYHDAIHDDARLALAVVRTALGLGATAVTRAEVVRPMLDGSGRATGVVAVDALTGSELEVRATRIVDATGVWAGRRDAPLGGSSVPLVPSRGTHLLVERSRLPLSIGMTLRVPGRVVFLVPVPGCWLIGTTDDPDSGPPDRPVPARGDVDTLLDTVNATLDVDLRTQDVLGAFAGLRPLVGAPGRGSTVKLSREHRVGVEPTGVVRISGGKYTTFRVMARDAVDIALGEPARSRRSRTADQPIAGAATAAERASLAAAIAAARGITHAQAEALTDRHGSEAGAVAALGAERDLLRPLGPGIDQLEAEVVWAVREELALSVDDVLARRMRLAAMLPDRGASIAPRVAELLGDELGWDAAERDVAVAGYLAGAHREYDVPHPPPGSGA
jgi:glycerol-3-phosphate dehydrogenase